MEQKQSFMDSLSPMQIFVFGIVEGILVLCTIFFFILLPGYLNGDTAPARDNAPSVVLPADNNAPSAPVAINLAEVDEKKDHIRGDKDAKITIVEYSDIECPFCSKFHATMNQVMDEFDGDVRWVYRHFPLSFHPNAKPAALAAECAGDQGKFWEFLDLAIERQQSGIDTARLKKIAAEVGLNTAKYETCVQKQTFASKLADDTASGSRAGANGTPYSVIVGPNGDKLPINGALPFENVKPMIEQFL